MTILETRSFEIRLDDESFEELLDLADEHGFTDIEALTVCLLNKFIRDNALAKQEESLEIDREFFETNRIVYFRVLLQAIETIINTAFNQFLLFDRFYKSLLVARYNPNNDKNFDYLYYLLKSRMKSDLTHSDLQSVSQELINKYPCYRNFIVDQMRDCLRLKGI
jgi:hypothetical protein